MRHLFSSNTVEVKGLVSVLIAVLTYAPLKSTNHSEEDAADTCPIFEMLHGLPSL
jgi:hypothetical protein